MIRSLKKTVRRTRRFVTSSLLWRGNERPYAFVSWGLIAGLIWASVHFLGAPPYDVVAFLGRVVLLIVLIAVCTIDARFGIIPDSLVWTLLIAGFIQAGLASVHNGASVRDWITGNVGETGNHAVSLTTSALEMAIVFAVAALLRIGYRVLRGHDGLGFGDVKFVAAASLWTGLTWMPFMLLAAVISALGSIAILRSEGHALGTGDAIAFGPHLALGVWFAVLTADSMRF